MDRCLNEIHILLCLALCISLEGNNGLVNALHKRTSRDLSRRTTRKDTFTPSPTTASSGEPQYSSRFVHNNKVADPKYGINKLKELCPLADICPQEGEVNPDNKKDSCCLPCKCDSVCKKMGNCCDTRDNEGDMCYLPYVDEEGIDTQAPLRYYLYDSCLNSSTSIDCRAEAAAPWGSLYPVYDPSTDLNYYNHHCAQCSGDQSYIYWDLQLKSLKLDWSLTHCLSLFSGAKHKGCTIGFTPPKQMNKMNHVCSRTLINSCNVSGDWSVYDAELEQACHKWFSPVLNRLGRLHYANIYCALCNRDDTYAPEDVCFGVAPDRNTFYGTLSMALDYRRVNTIINNPSTTNTRNTKNGNCGRLTVKYPSKAECRTILCPNGFLRDKEEVCVPISNNWLVDSYFIQLILSPIGTNLLPWSYLTDLSSQQKRYPETWFTSHITPLCHFQMRGKRVIVKNETYVGELLVRVGREKYPLNIAKETEIIQNAMRKNWTITLKGRFFKFTVAFDRYASFIPDGMSRRHDLIGDYTSSLHYVHEEKPIPKVYELIHYIRYTDLTVSVLKKTNFCERVRLFRSEWTAGFQEIHLNISSGVSGDETVLGDSEFDLYIDDSGIPMIEICVENFNPKYLSQRTVESGTVSITSPRSHIISILVLTVIFK